MDAHCKQRLLMALRSTSLMVMRLVQVGIQVTASQRWQPNRFGWVKTRSQA